MTKPVISQPDKIPIKTIKPAEIKILKRKFDSKKKLEEKYKKKTEA